MTGAVSARVPSPADASWPIEPFDLSPRTILRLIAAATGCAALYIVFLAGSAAEIDSFRQGEGGLLELSQDALLMACLLLCIAIARRARSTGLRIWSGLIFVVLFVLLGEEISWGQHLFGWATTGWFAAHNYQHETNIHNVDDWLGNGLPRRIMIAGAIVAGGLYPVGRRLLKVELPVARWLAPRLDCAAPALFTAVPTSVERWPALAPLTFGNDVFQMTEIAEFFLYLFFVAYLYALHRAARAQTHDASA